MDDYKFVIDELEIVHHAWCALTYYNTTPYGSLAKTHDEMIESLARPDVRNGHSAPSPLAPCDACILGLDSDE